MPQRHTAQKLAISQAITGSKRPLTAHEVLEAARSDVPSLGIATVYRQLKRLVDEEAITSVELPGEPARYESSHHGHHHHFCCHTCGRVFDVDGCHAQIDTGVPPGFVVERHGVFLYGVCANCG